MSPQVPDVKTDQNRGPRHRFREGRKRDGQCAVCGRRRGAAVHRGQTPSAEEPPASPPPPSGQNTDGLSAFDVLKNYFESFGMVFDAELETLIKKFMIEGFGPEDINLLMPDLEQTKAFKDRFVGYHSRIANGYNAISVFEYLEMEDAYHRILQEAGLPAGFYDEPSDFGEWIAGNVSVNEVQSRVQMAVKAAQSIDPTARSLMAQFYGLSTGDIASYFLDQERALPVIERQYKAANVAAWAQRSGLSVSEIGRYENLVDLGVTEEQAAQSYGTIKSLSDTVGRIAGTYGETFDQTDAEDDVFFGRSDKRRKIVAQEAATFAGRSQGATGSARRQSY